IHRDDGTEGMLANTSPVPGSQPFGNPRLRPGEAQVLYDPANEHDACGVAFVADMYGRRSNAIVRDALTALHNLDHRGASGAEVNTGDGAGLLLQVPDAFLRAVA